MARWKWGFAQRLALVSVAALVLRVGYVLLFRRDDLPLGGDSLFYSLGAELLADGHGFVEPLTVVGAGPVEQSASHPPLYLLWLAALSFVDPGGTSQLVHMLWSCVLGTGTVIACGLAGREVAGPRCGLVAAVLAAVYPNVWVHDGMLLSETMSLFTTAMVILLAYRFWHRPSGRRVAWLGLWCGLATLSRPELVLTVPLVLAPLVLRSRGVARPRRLRWLTAGGAAAMVALAPWVVFNLTRFDERVYLSTNSGSTLAAANCDATYHGAQIGSKNYECARDVFASVVRPGMDPSERDEAVRREAFRYVRANRDRLPAVVAARWGRITGLLHPRQEIAFDQFFSQRDRWVAESTLYSYYVIAALAVGGALVLRRRRVPLLPLVAFPVIVLVSVALTFAQSRYRAPAEAALVVLAAVAIDAGIRRMANRRRARDELAMMPDEPVPARASAGVPVQDSA
ncbi:MAG: glycosyltransferase family 39 protein [Acidimicrobiia bacterium]